ncbi:hypothetical protein K402DRAFT_369830 [Aulographum hederae CBS 113979]|uniref:Zn(2)-C6 fungal-type domain-containing protein n=1 Tax=Aulographum hederae CBS 113979 TaxID=1176131 RepID=A0A6G1HC97_9PEZI|nr:hypothetical protein K402DRAFT_369830 [Aulographum hederae CBS 113979]
MAADTLHNRPFNHNRIAKSSAAGEPPRRRISRACDQCNQLRTKCDGRTPCQHCVEFGLACEYNRVRKKRGKASRKDVALQQAAAGLESNTSSSTDHFDRATDDVQEPALPVGTDQSLNKPVQGEKSPLAPISRSLASIESSNKSDSMEAPRSLPSFAQIERANSLDNQALTPSSSSGWSRNSVSDRGGLQSITNAFRPFSSTGNHAGSHRGSNDQSLSSNVRNDQATQVGQQSDLLFSLGGQQTPQLPSLSFQMTTGNTPPNNFSSFPNYGSPSWLPPPTPNYFAQHPNLPELAHLLRYPVLQPLLPYIGSILPIQLACDLLDIYFQSTSSAFMQPESPYVLGYVFRKRSFLRQTNPRVCTPALLASFLWIGAQTSEAAFFTSPPSSRGRICQKLLELTVGLLKPLIHGGVGPDSSSAFGGNAVFNGVALGGLGVHHQGNSQDPANGSPGAAGGLDDVATYMHLATVVSATEYKAASLRWWNAAWSLARELKLGRELAQDEGVPGSAELGPLDGHRDSSNRSPTEEGKEERRRIWWTLYIVDRHLSLCYNKPLFLLDAECENLLHPVDEIIWQSGEYYTGRPANTSPFYYSWKGPSFECTGHSIYGHFLPVMSILGEIIDLNQARNHPRLGQRFRTSADWDEQAGEITSQLEAYGRSLQAFNNRHTGQDGNDTHNEGGNPTARMSESVLQTKIVVAYGTHLMHTLHILLNGKWDPISLLDDNDLWISSQSFITATGHAVSAAEALNDILEYDPDLSFEPFFFGIYLLQSSFLLLLIADKLGGDASTSVVKACETIVRAHEACVVTLNTEYQRNFRKVMRSALAQVKGRGMEDIGEQQLKRREVLALYRWTGDGTGLAL